MSVHTQRSTVLQDYKAQMRNEGNKTFLLINEEDSLDHAYPLQVIAKDADEACRWADRVIDGVETSESCYSVSMEINGIVEDAVHLHTRHGVDGAVRLLSDEENK